MSNLIGGRRAGSASIAIDGEPYDITDSNYQPSTVKRETLTGQNAVQGWKETPVAPFIEATIRDAGSLTVASFNAMTSVTVTLVLANGKTVTGDGMWNTECEPVETGEATFKVKFEGFVVEESN